MNPDDEGELPLVVKSKSLKSFTTSKEEFGILSYIYSFVLFLFYFIGASFPLAQVPRTLGPIGNGSSSFYL